MPYNRLVNATLDLLIEVSKLSFAYKSWRKEAWETFLDIRFFAMTPANFRRWKAIVQAVLANERDRLEDILGRIATHNTGIFTSKEQESLNRALMLRKMSFLLFCGDRDQFLPQLPNIQEKMVDIFKQPYNVFHAEVRFFIQFKIAQILGVFMPSCIILQDIYEEFGQFLARDIIRIGSAIPNGRKGAFIDTEP